jgi:hypothetical protein
MIACSRRFLLPSKCYSYGYAQRVQANAKILKLACFRQEKAGFAAN